MASTPSAELAVPDVRQSTGYTCGAAALQAVLAYYGISSREDRLSAQMGATPSDGIAPQAIVRTARAHGLAAELRENMTVEELALEVRERRPVIVELQAWADPPRTHWESDWDDGHYAILVGIEKDELVFEDPSVLGSRAQLSRQEFEARWHDIDFGQRHIHAGILFRGRAPAPPAGRVRME
ncbi:MAG TPA: cysteine peptidase family C39 domain-containing protein [Polyangiaceae bacterium]|nr:cysteine peptidase family C39 domain-containing protein [Polyangiaceae bacterium]